MVLNECYSIVHYDALYDLSFAASKKWESAKPLFSNSKKLVEIFIFMACASRDD